MKPTRRRSTKRANGGRRSSVFQLQNSKSFNQLSEFYFDEDVSCVKLCVEWTTSRIDTICDLDLNVYVFDDHARFLEKLNIDNPVTEDGSCSLEADIDTFEKSKTHVENAVWNFNKVSPQTSCMLFCITGGQRNFINVESMALRCTDAYDKSSIPDDSSDFAHTVSSHMHANEFTSKEFFTKKFKPRRDSENMIAMIVYQNGRHSNGKPAWVCRLSLQQLQATNDDEKEVVCGQAVISAVPSLSKYRKHIFPSVKSLCASLSSTSLPLLKNEFCVGDGLKLNAFTKVLFRELNRQNPKVSDRSEAPYTVALLHDMFHQIDFNENGDVDWDEFTTFCIYTGLVSLESEDDKAGRKVGPPDEYHIEYVEDHSLKDHVNNKPHSQLKLMRYFPEVRRFAVIPENPSKFSLFDESLKVVSEVDPEELFVYEKNTSRVKDSEALEVLDVCYIPFRDMYSFSSSDHTITVMKPHTDSSGVKIHYTSFNIIHSAYRQTKLCWSETSKILCSVSSRNDIFGWTLDGKSPIFQVSRHKEKITDLLAIDSHGLFATCSLDKRVVLWSQVTQRVRGVLAGHGHGIKVMAYSKNILVTAGFEIDARVWSLPSQENTLILRGHRSPLVDVKIMSPGGAYSSSIQAVTVDDRSEMRLWNVAVKAGTDVIVIGSLKTFSPREGYLSQIRFLSAPFHQKYSREKYSNIICCSSELLQFKPERVSKDFLPASHMSYSAGNTALLLSVGRSFFKYDVNSGSFLSSIPNVDKAEIMSFCADDRHRIYVGCSNGDILLLNFSTGQIISSIRAHQRPVTALSLVKLGGGCNMIYSGSGDGTLRTIEDTCGSFAVNNTAGKAFQSEKGPITIVRNLMEAKFFLAVSSGVKWGAWTDSTLKNIFTFAEDSRVLDVVEILPRKQATDTFGRGIATVVICTPYYLKVYALDFKHMDFQMSHVLGNKNTLIKRSFASVIILRCPENSVNYADSKDDDDISEVTLVASSDDGYIMGWDAKNLREESIGLYFDVKPDYKEVYMKKQVYLEFEAVQSKQNRMNKRIAFKESQKYLDAQLLATAENSDSDESSYWSSDDSCHSDDALDDKSLFSLTSQAGLLDINTNSGVNVKLMAHTVRCNDDDAPEHEGKKNVTLPPTAISQSDNGAAPQRSRGRNAIFLKQDTFKVQLDSEEISRRTILYDYIWKAHDGPISCIAGLDEHGCVVTSGTDGLIRIWNLRQNCLGIFLLPNLTEEMKENFRQNNVKYRFIMEKISVTKKHERLADKIMEIIKFEDGTGKCNTEFRRQMTSGQNIIVVAKEEEERISRKNFTDQDIVREGFLKQITQNADDVDNASRHHHPPSVNVNRPNTCPAAMCETVLSTTTPEEETESTTQESFKRAKNLSRPSTSNTRRASAITRMPSIGEILKMKPDKRFDASVHLKRRKKSTGLDSVYGSDETWVDASHIMENHQGLKAFTEKSVVDSLKSGLIDHEGHMCLRKITGDRVKVEAYDRSVDKILLKNIKQSTTVKVGSMNTVKRPEILFGQQKNMYGNANKLVNSRRARTSTNDKHLMAMSMIKHSAKRHVGTMLSTVNPLKDFNDNIAVPGAANERESEEKADESTDASDHSQMIKTPKIVVLTQGRQAKRRTGVVSLNISADDGKDKKLDRVKVAHWIQKVTDAEEGAIPDWEARQTAKKLEKERKRIKKNRMDNVTKTHAAVKTLETKLVKSINSYHEVVGIHGDTFEVKPVTTRDLLPYYRASDFKGFCNVYLSVDEFFKGFLDVYQWVDFFSKLKKTVSSKTAHGIFSDLDTDSDGLLNLEDLIDYIFSKATPQQLDLMKNNMLKTVKKNQAVGSTGLTSKELIQMFEYYDEDFVGYIKVRNLKDRLKSFNLPLPAQAIFDDTFKELYDDDMISLEEFLRMFKSYTIINRIE